jgi:electron transfer flavoprotein alpha subunit
MAADGDELVVERTDLGGRVDQSLASRCPVAGLFAGDDGPASTGGAAPVERLDATPEDVRIERVQPVPGATGGVTTADRVVSVGRGLKRREDLVLVEELAGALGAEIACSMPIADDVGWVAKERYIGRSGQHIAPRLYLALGISGTPQHLEGVRDARVVVAVNTDPEAHIFRRADYGIVGDLYEVVPAIRSALGR